MTADDTRRPVGRFTYAFDHPHDDTPRSLAQLLGGKGANLAEMLSVLGLPVPPGFTITTDAWRDFDRTGWPATLDAEIARQLERVEQALGRRYGDPDNPLLLSVRSGAPASMPGMLDTVLNLGLNEATVDGLARRTSPRFAYDTYHHFIALFACVVLGVPQSALDPAEVTGDATAHDEGGMPHRRYCGISVRRCCAGWRLASDSPFPAIRPCSCVAPSRRCSGRGTAQGRRRTAATKVSTIAPAPP